MDLDENSTGRTPIVSSTMELSCSSEHDFSSFTNITEDILLKILFKLDDDPRHWAVLSCVCSRFNTLIKSVCCKAKCSSAIPSVVSDLLHSSNSELVTHFGYSTTSSSSSSSSSKIDVMESEPPGGWFSLQKINVCCPGLLHAGVLFDSCDYGLERAIGPDHNRGIDRNQGSSLDVSFPASNCWNSASDCGNWSLFDDLHFDAAYDESECEKIDDGLSESDKNQELFDLGLGEKRKVVGVENSGKEGCGSKRRKNVGHAGAHMASGLWNLSREEGNKLLASRFRGDCLYICNWPGCEHAEEKRSYKLFRGVFKNFKKSGVWRNIKDTKAKKSGIRCAFCDCDGTWDLLSCFCLRRLWEYHDDGEPVVRAYVCENGHVSGAWTDRPMYT